ncbi:Gfo/Idh/MocA family protein [Sphingobium sp. TKS]|uniref:Putative oxidoreductase n=1 Tax=Sphingomonas sp. NS2 TaxID=908605 RepID=A0A0D4ZZM2_9SPHN|nr:MULTISPECIES: Gfo/Idh/MocA family oxidoreductase [unclassified Sphingobium]AJW29386.1 putative oxidoreductase [Sphingomonas sp. NS2]AMK26587.1 oxidoreductase [Sphingobium sp. TKS]MEC6699607.1 Gfo/Idh/MocA family oxidoreductase [Sphingobium sp. SJ10-10]
MPGTAAPLGVGFIGLSAKGGWAATAHFEALRAMPDRFVIRALSASTPGSAQAAGEAHDIGFATDDPAILAAQPGIDLVVVTVKVPHHKELVAQALNRGKAVYCEWPLGKDLDEGRAIAASAEERGVRAFVGLQGRSAPAIRYLRDLVRKGYVGEVISSNVIGAGGFPWGGAAMAGMAYVLDDTSGATMLSIPFGHMVDMFTWVLGDFSRLHASLATRYPLVKLVDADGSVDATAPDQIAVGGILDSGAVVALQYRGGDAPECGFRWEINGRDGVLIVEGNSGHLQYGHVRISGRQGTGPTDDLTVPAQYRLLPTDPLGYSDAVAHAYRAVHEDLTTGSSIAPTFDDAVKTHRLLDRIERAADWNRRSSI